MVINNTQLKKDNVLTDGKNPEMTTEQLIGWYEKFGFKEDRGLLRNPAGRKKNH